MSKITALYERNAHPDAERIRRQRNNLETFAQSKGFQNLQHFSDDGFSAFNYDRPGFKALMASVEANEVGTVIVSDTSRITRDAAVHSNFIDTMEKKGIRFIAVMDRIDFLPLHIHDDDNGLDYTLNGDYYFPDITVDEENDNRPVGKWGLMHEQYLKQYRPELYFNLSLSGKLHKHLRETNEAAVRRINGIIRQLKKTEGVNEKLKAEDQMEWVRRMNSILSRAEEVVKAELIFV